MVDKYLDKLDFLAQVLHSLDGAVDRKEWEAARWFASSAREVSLWLEMAFEREAEMERPRKVEPVSITDNPTTKIPL